jgi:hypothetical protein
MTLRLGPLTEAAVIRTVYSGQHTGSAFSQHAQLAIQSAVPLAYREPLNLTTQNISPCDQSEPGTISLHTQKS